MATQKSLRRYLLITNLLLCCIAHTRFRPEYLSPFSTSATLEEIQNEAARAKRTHRQDKKKWTFIVYIAADNDLKGFAARNIKQMSAIGSNEHINVIVHLDIKVARDHKITRRYYIENNRVLHVNPNDPTTERMDSGNPKTLISCCKWAIEQYPADHYALIFWNHGTGIIDPARGRILNPAQLFAFNEQHNRFDINRSIEFLDWADNCKRGICWDDTTGNYLTNQKVDQALEHIRTEYMQGKKFSIIGFDACLMSMIEVANIMKRHADFMVGSQEVELGTGYNYALTLEPFLHTSLYPEDFARQMVKAYEQTYGNITNDYTQSAIVLEGIDALEDNVNLVASLLITALTKQKNHSVKHTLKKCRNKLSCTHFDEPRYIDLHHFYCNVLNHIHQFAFSNTNEGGEIINRLRSALNEGLKIIEEVVVANSVGRNLNKARGISIYFPEDIVHPSYPQTTFARSNTWAQFIQKYIRS